MESLLNQLSKLLVNRRKELNISQEELASWSRIAVRSIRDLEKGKGNPSLTTVHQLLMVLGIEVIFKLRK